jgi:hypothetical protein
MPTRTVIVLKLLEELDVASYEIVKKPGAAAGFFRCGRLDTPWPSGDADGGGHNSGDTIITNLITAVASENSDPTISMV